MDVLFRLLVAAFVVVAPSVLFVLFYRGLVRMRDEDLVTRVLDRMDETGTGRRDPASVLTGGVFDPTSRRDADAVACGRCGAPNPPYTTYCGTCLERLG